MRLTLATTAVLLLTGCGGGDHRPTIPLYDNLGSFSVPISTLDERAQAYFDQGMRLAYAFNHAEAIRAFREAALIDPTCAICHWGVALALGPNINAPMDSASAAAAWLAIERARALASGASDRERALIEALRVRYDRTSLSTRSGLDSAYARAMATVAHQLPDDLEAATLYADALMNLSPWNYWDGAGKPRPGTEAIMVQLEKVIARDSLHPGACHLFIHAVEAVTPQRGVGCAERLAAVMPGAGHLVHMPAHIYVRVGRYDEAIEQNQHATHADSALALTERPSPAYATIYVPHNYHFLGFAASLAGRSEIALHAARETAAKVPRESAHAYPELAQPLIAFEHLMLLKFGRWEELLALPLAQGDLPLARALTEYARGTALAASGRPEEARMLVDAVASRADGLPDGVVKGIIGIARHSLEGEIAARTGQWREAEVRFREAVAIEDALGYMEPPWWVEPVRQALGATLLGAKKPREAEAVYHEDLARFPRNCWSLYGLWQAQAAQRQSQAAAAERDFRDGCAKADVQITTSHF